MADLKPCPCGKTPTSLLVDPTGTSKYATVCGNCCTEWMVEFRTEYEKIDSPECMALAIPAWNAAPRPLEVAKDATLAEIRAILSGPVRGAIDGFPTPTEMNSIYLPRDQWKRLHELLGGDHG